MGPGLSTIQALMDRTAETQEGLTLRLHFCWTRSILQTLHAVLASGTRSIDRSLNNSGDRAHDMITSGLEAAGHDR